MIEVVHQVSNKHYDAMTGKSTINGTYSKEDIFVMSHYTPQNREQIEGFGWHVYSPEQVASCRKATGMDL